MREVKIAGFRIQELTDGRTKVTNLDGLSHKVSASFEEVAESYAEMAYECSEATPAPTPKTISPDLGDLGKSWEVKVKSPTGRILTFKKYWSKKQSLAICGVTDEDGGWSTLFKMDRHNNLTGPAARYGLCRMGRFISLLAMKGWEVEGVEVSFVSCVHCRFCTKSLTDPRSTEVGYGPVCADIYGLPWGEKNKGAAA